MEKSFIKFSEDGTSFVINLAKGSETMDIESKEEGFKAITKLANEKKITPGEFTEMRDQLLEAKNLPWSESKSLSISIDLIGGGIGLGSIADILEFSNKPVESAQFKVCPNCGKHGRIYTKDWYTSSLNSKKSALSVLEELKKDEDLTQEEFEKIKTEIETSEIPEE